MGFMSSCICDVHFKSKQSECILKPPTEYRFTFYLNPLKKKRCEEKREKISSREDVDEISIGGLFHKRQNFLFCVSHLILSNMPKAIRPRAHCLKNASFMRTPPPSNNEWGAWLLGSASATAFRETRRRQMRFKSGDAKWHTHAQENGPVSLFVCLSHAAISVLNCSRPTCAVFTYRIVSIDAEQTDWLLFFHLDPFYL